MKKYVSLFLTLCMLVAVLVPFMALTVGADGESTATGAITPDTSWYDEHKEDTDLYINDAADLLGFSKLLSTQMKVNDGDVHEADDITKVDATLKIFYGKTVHITADIDLNPGWTLDENNPTKPTNVWLNQPYHSFTGMIDGHGYTISGIWYDCSTNASNHVGIFGNLKGGTEEKPVGAKNLAIVNSYVNSNGNGTFGGLFGGVPASESVLNHTGYYLLENIYVDILTVSSYATANAGYYMGGLIGYVTDKQTVTIKNCIVNSTIKVPANQYIRPVGGFVGGIFGTVTIEDSLFTGSVTTNGNWIGGFVGVLYGSSGKLTIKNCLEAGDIRPSSGTVDFNAHGSILAKADDGKVSVTNSIYTDCYYYSKNDKKFVKGQNLYGAKNTNENSKISAEDLATNIYVPDDDVYGLGMAEKLTTAGMTNWTVTTVGCPMPRSMVIMFPWLVNQDDAAKTPVTKLAGYQVSDATDGKMNLRLVATVKFPEGKGLADYTAVGFRVVANYGNVTKYTNISTTEVYTGVAGYTKGGTAVTEYTAASLGGDYVFVLPCQGVPADQTIIMEVTTYYVTADGETVGATVAFTINASSTALPQ